MSRLSNLFSRRPQAVTLHVRQKTQGAFSALNFHIAGVALLGLLNLYLLIHMGVLWQQAHNQDAEALSRQEVSLETARIASQPLEGLDAKLKRASTEADNFTSNRLPVSYSEVAQEIGVLAKRNNVRLTRGSYAQAAVVGEAAGQLTEVRIDYSLSGSYGGLVHFVNDLERDRVFFLITGVTLTGQQSGTVNLRARITTYIHGGGSEADLQRVSFDTTQPQAAAAQAGGTQ